MSSPINYLQSEVVKNLFVVAPSFRKKEETLLRLWQLAELGTELKTWVTGKNGHPRVETVNTIKCGTVIARNPKEIGVIEGEKLFNEWLIPIDTVEKNYGKAAVDSLTDRFQPFKKVATVKAIKLSKALFEELGGCSDSGVLKIAVSWGSGEMDAVIGDILTDAGYSVAEHHFEEGYEIKWF